MQQKDVLLQGLERLMSHDARAVLSEAQRPTLVLMTDDDAITPPPFMEALYLNLSFVTLKKHDRGGHAFPFTYPQWCHEEITQFLTHIEP
jgi:predicted alpha/beta-fold hydrolase